MGPAAHPATPLLAARAGIARHLLQLHHRSRLLLVGEVELEKEKEEIRNGLADGSIKVIIGKFNVYFFHGLLPGPVVKEQLCPSGYEKI